MLTAYGVFQGMRASAQHAWGDPTLRGRKVGIAGVGKVGHLLVEHLLQDGAEVVITDVRADSVARVRTKYPQVTAVADTEALIRTKGLDVYAPCALGGALSDESLPVLSAKVVCGAANNQLDHPGVEKELSDRGILYAPDYVVNAAWVSSRWPMSCTALTSTAARPRRRRSSTPRWRYSLVRRPTAFRPPRPPTVLPSSAWRRRGTPDPGPESGLVGRKHSLARPATGGQGDIPHHPSAGRRAGQVKIAVDQRGRGTLQVVPSGG